MIDDSNIVTICCYGAKILNTDDYAQWKKMYTDSSNKYSVAKYLASVGQDFGGDRVIKFHDEVCRSHSNLKLA